MAKRERVGHDFMVRVEISLPAEMPPDQRNALIEEEFRRGSELVASGLLRAIWRLPGRMANVSLYRARDATELHEALSSLPLWPWMSVHVDALAEHPLTSRMDAGEPSEDDG